MRWGDVKLCQTSTGQEYLEFNERETKTRSGNDPRNVRAIAPKMFAVPNNEKCPVRGRPFNSWGGGGGGGWMISGQQAFFFSSNLVGRIFVFLLNALQNIFFPSSFLCRIFFPQKSVMCFHLQNVFTFTLWLLL